MSTLVPNQLLKKPLRFCDGRDSRPTILKAPPQARPARPRMPVDAGQVQLEIRNDPNKLKWVEQARLKFEKNRNPYGQYGQPYKIGEQFRDKYDPIADVGYGLSRVPVKFRRVRAPAVPQLSAAQAQACLKNNPAKNNTIPSNYTQDINRAINHNRVNTAAISNAKAPYSIQPPKNDISVHNNYISPPNTISVAARVTPTVTVNPRLEGKPKNLRDRILGAASTKATTPYSRKIEPPKISMIKYIENKAQTSGITPIASPPVIKPIEVGSVSSKYVSGNGNWGSVNTNLSIPHKSEMQTAITQNINPMHYTDHSRNITASTSPVYNLGNSVQAEHPIIEKPYDLGAFDARSYYPSSVQTTPISSNNNEYPITDFDSIKAITNIQLRNKGPATIGRGNFNYTRKNEIEDPYSFIDKEYDYMETYVNNPNQSIMVEGYTDDFDNNPAIGYSSPLPNNTSGHPGMIDNQDTNEYYHQNRARFQAGLQTISVAEQKNRNLRDRINYMKGPAYMDTGDPILQKAWNEY